MGKKIGKRPKRRMKLPLPGSYLIATEGIQTEVLYFKQLAAEVKQTYDGFKNRIEVTVPSLTIRGTGVSNLTLVEQVAEIIQVSPNLFEHVWLVFDKDDIPLDYFDNAIQSAHQRGWHVAWSNDSFELWYLLHFEYLNAAIDREEYKRKLTGYLQQAGIAAHYEKNATKILTLLTRDKRWSAIRLAKKLEGQYLPNTPFHQRNPGTTVHVLVEELMVLEKIACQLREQK